MHSGFGPGHFGRAEFVDSFDDPLFDTFGHRWHVVVFVMDSDVVDRRFKVLVEFTHAIEDDDDGFISPGRVVGSHGWEGHRVKMAMAVLVLKAFAVERGASGRAADEEPFGTHVGCGPDRVANALESEHRVVNIERNHVDAVGRIRCPSGDETRHRSALGDPFFEDLAVLGFLVIGDRAGVDGFVKLTGVGVDPDLLEHTFHSEGSRLVRDDRNDVRTDLLVFDQSVQ